MPLTFAGDVMMLVQGAICGLLCALVGLRVRSVSGSRGRWSAQVRAHGQNRDRTWAHGRPQCQYPWGVHCRLHTLSVLCSCAVVALLPALYACRQIAREVVKWCCGGLPPPGKGPSPAVWGEGLYRLSLDAVDVRATGCRTLRVPKWVRLVAPLPLLEVGEDLGLCGPGSSLFRYRRWPRFEIVRPSGLGLQDRAGCAASGGRVALPPGSRLCCFVLAFRLLFSWAWPSTWAPFLVWVWGCAASGSVSPLLIVSTRRYPLGALSSLMLHL